MTIEWSPEFSIKNVLLDEQHKGIFELANKIYRLSEKMANSPSKHIDKEQLKPFVMSLFKYIKVHFHEEEKYMKSINFPLLKEHQQSHKILFDKAKELVFGTKDSELFLNDLLELVHKWVLEHILFEDIQIEAFAHRALDINEIYYSLEQYTKIFRLKHNIKPSNQDSFYVYTCACANKTHRVLKPLHEELVEKKQFLRCKDCEQPLIFIDPNFLNEDRFKELQKRVLMRK